MNVVFDIDKVFTSFFLALAISSLATEVRRPLVLLLPLPSLRFLRYRLLLLFRPGLQLPRSETLCPRPYPESGSPEIRPSRGTVNDAPGLFESTAYLIPEVLITPMHFSAPFNRCVQGCRDGLRMSCETENFTFPLAHTRPVKSSGESSFAFARSRSSLNVKSVSPKFRTIIFARLCWWPGLQCISSDNTTGISDVMCAH
mmetsp:Transcript_73442/g.201706  ORF Transcript_73442/g.201706 Transcript_73442/m.201706 type:complete len:200 (+) Transcript_73442:211-810(+)